MPSCVGIVPASGWQRIADRARAAQRDPGHVLADGLMFILCGCSRVWVVLSGRDAGEVEQVLALGPSTSARDEEQPAGEDHQCDKEGEGPTKEDCDKLPTRHTTHPQTQSLHKGLVPA